MSDFLHRLFDSNERDIAKYRVTVDKINALEPETQKLSNTQLRAKTDKRRTHLQTNPQSAIQNQK